MQIQFRLLTPSLVLYILWLTSTCSKEGDTKNEICVYANVSLYNSTYFIMLGQALQWNDAEKTCIQYGMKIATVVEDVIPKVEAVIRKSGLNTTFRAWIGCNKDSSQGLLICNKDTICGTSTSITANKNDGNSSNNDEHNKLQETLLYAFICEMNSGTILNERSFKNLSLRRLDRESQYNCEHYPSTEINIPFGSSGTPVHEGYHKGTVLQWVCVGLASVFALVFILLLLLVAWKRRTRRNDNGLQISGQSDHLNTFQTEQSSQVSGTKDTATGMVIMSVEAYNRAYDAFRPNDDSRYIYQEPELGAESEDVSEVLDVSNMVDLDIANGVNESPKRNSLKVEDQNEIPRRSQDHIYAKVIKTKL